MAFVMSSLLTLGAGAQVAIPLMVDVSGNTDAHHIYTHFRVPGGTTYTFDTGQSYNIPASTDTLGPMPPGAKFVTAVGASTMQLGRNVD